MKIWNGPCLSKNQRVFRKGVHLGNEIRILADSNLKEACRETKTENQLLYEARLFKKGGYPLASKLMLKNM
jgi:hypothetical protein